MDGADREARRQEAVQVGRAAALLKWRLLQEVESADPATATEAVLLVAHLKLSSADRPSEFSSLRIV